MIKLANPVLDQARGKLYVTGFLSTHLAVVDLASRRLERSVDMGVTGGFLLPDPTDGGLYLFDIGMKRYFRLDPLRGGSQPLADLPGHLRLPARKAGKSYGQRMFLESGFPFRPGFLQDSNAAYNVIKVADAQGREQGQILHGPDALYFDIDQTRGLLYGSNTGDASLSVFDLTDGNRWQGDIKVGASVEELAWDPAGQALYIRNRLGGSQVCRWQPDLDQTRVLGNENELQRGGLGMWPTGMGLYQDRFYVLSHYAGRLDVYDAAGGSWIKSLDLGLPQKPRTDAISQMVLDERRGRLYAAFPELGLVTGLDLNSEASLGSFSIPLSGQVSGPFHLLLEVSQATGRLYVFVPSQGQLQVREGANLALLQQASLPPCERERLTMRLDDRGGLLYLGDHILDSGSLAQRGRLEPGQRVAQVDPRGGRLYVARATRLSPVQVQEELTEYLDGQPGRQWTFSPVARLPLSYAFDWDGGRFFVGYFETAQVEEHPL